MCFYAKCPNIRRWLALTAGLYISIIVSANTARPIGRAAAASSVVKVVERDGAFHLQRNGEEYFVKGAGGDGSRELLRACGGNSVRTWGVDNLGPVLDEAWKQGLTVTAGIWLGHKEHGFDYNSAEQVAEQYEKARAAISRASRAPR